MNPALERALSLGPRYDPPIPPWDDISSYPGVFDDEKRGPCCGHCGADLGVPGPLSEPGAGNLPSASKAKENPQ